MVEMKILLSFQVKWWAGWVLWRDDLEGQFLPYMEKMSSVECYMEKMRRCGVLHGADEQCGVEGVELVPVFPSQIYIYIYICPMPCLYSSETDPDPVHRTNSVQKAQRKRHVSERERNNFIWFYGNHKSKCLTWPLCVFYILPSRSPLDLVIYHANMGIFSYFSSCYTLKMG